MRERMRNGFPVVGEGWVGRQIRVAAEMRWQGSGIIKNCVLSEAIESSGARPSWGTSIRGCVGRGLRGGRGIIYCISSSAGSQGNSCYAG
ncbi:hypothetical protein J6590_071386 [Homalodisca vitripennis]|nr:hypothetical protein J6590_071386 [Homalodisca vitripennis]